MYGTYGTYGTNVINGPFGPKLCLNADFTASGVPHMAVENFIVEHVYKNYANTHSNSYNGKLMVDLINQAKDIIHKQVNAGPEYKILFAGSGCTGALNLLIHSIQPLIQKSNRSVVIFLSEAEHHSNYLPWTHLERPGLLNNKKIEIVIIPVLHKTGKLDLITLRKQLHVYRNYRIIASITACSNVTGIINDTHLIASYVHQYSGLIFFDYACSAPYVPIDMKGHLKDYLPSKCDFDAIFLSPHKFLGGPNTPGLLIAKESLFQNHIPICPGGGTVRFVCKKFTRYADDPEIYEQGGTPNIIGIIRTGLAFMLKAENMSLIQQREKEVNIMAINFFRAHPELKLIGINLKQSDTDLINRIPIYSVRIRDFHYNYVVALLSDIFGIQSRGGVSCASLYAQCLLKISENKQQEIYKCIIDGKGMPNNYGWCRITLNYMMKDYEVMYILNALKHIHDHGHEYLNLYEYNPKGSSFKHKNYEYKFPKLNLQTEVTPIREITESTLII